jgi:hypothetical protein
MWGRIAVQASEGKALRLNTIFTREELVVKR